MIKANFYIFGNLKQWCKDNGYSVLILRSNENLGVICKKFEKELYLYALQNFFVAN